MKTHERPAMKTCKICNVLKQDSNFYHKYATCKECTLEKQKVRSNKYYQDNKEKVLERTKVYYSNRKEIYLEYKQKYRAENPDKEVLNRKNCRNKDIIKSRINEAAFSAKRRALKASSTPKWANLDKIRSIYLECQLITMKTGIEHHVDHIIPLKGKLVSGLHVETNLRIITASENCKKSNKIIEEIV